ncbi:hypothetical protein [Selenomonas sp. FC4001]|uniref:hypothetical protein n=1 Tax=Selenomonas sp. FC4001 TaxID=1408313 RepID=UPI00055E273D|nr:hypothetical protein [Selenomonas sp. FC4001]
MAWQKNIRNINDGSYRSLSGAAAENLFFGRAQQAGFPCLSKEWRDMECDGAILSGRALYRIEIKGSSNNEFSLTHGQRAGVQIDKRVNKERLLSVEDCDFAVCIDKNNGDCYILPIDIAVIYGRKNISKNNIQTYREKWQLFVSSEDRLTEEEIKSGLLNYPLERIEMIADRFNIVAPNEDYRPMGTRRIRITAARRKELLIVLIWEYLATHLVEGQDLNEND